MHTPPFSIIWPSKVIRLYGRPGRGEPVARLTPDQVQQVRRALDGYAFGEHLVAATDLGDLGYTDLVTIIALGYDSIGQNQVILVVSQGIDPLGEMGTLEFAVMPYAPPWSDSPLAQLGAAAENIDPHGAAELMGQIVADIRAIEGLIPPAIPPGRDIGRKG